MKYIFFNITGQNEYRKVACLLSAHLKTGLNQEIV